MACGTENQKRGKNDAIRRKTGVFTFLNPFICSSQKFPEKISQKSIDKSEKICYNTGTKDGEDLVSSKSLSI